VQKKDKKDIKEFYLNHMGYKVKTPGPCQTAREKFYLNHMGYKVTRHISTKRRNIVLSEPYGI